MCYCFITSLLARKSLYQILYKQIRWNTKPNTTGFYDKFLKSVLLEVFPLHICVFRSFPKPSFEKNVKNQERQFTKLFVRKPTTLKALPET